jgi:SAM-dependent methyltransferase
VFRRRRAPPPASAESCLHEAFWILLGRAPSDTERQEFRRHHAAGGEPAVRQRLLSSPEFHLIFSGWKDDLGIGKDPAAHEAGLRALGSHEPFVRRVYQLLLDRDADEAGLRHYVAMLEAGEARRNFIRVLVTSDEFEARYRPIASQEGGGYVPRDVQLCELANPAKWDNPDWLRLLKSLQVVPAHKLAMHRKSYEWTQLLFGLERLGALSDAASVLSVGAGHECVLYWLANRAGRVVAVDLYEGRWRAEGAREGDERVMERPEAFAPFPYRAKRLSFRRMDGRALGFPDSSFDVVYSLSSIEHFGGYDGARAALLEIARVLAPGGILALATEYILDGPDHDEAFQPDAFARLIEVPGLTLVEPVDTRIYRRYDARTVDLGRNLDQRPHMVVRIGQTVFTSVMVFLRKSGNPHDGRHPIGRG